MFAKKKLLKRLTSLAAAAVMALGLTAGLGATPAFADTDYNGSTISLTNSQLAFTKYARQDNVTSIDDATFTFTLAPYTGTIEDDTTSNGFPVLKGLGTSQTVTLNTRTTTQMTTAETTTTNSLGNNVSGILATSVNTAAVFDLSSDGLLSGSTSLAANTCYRYQITESSSNDRFVNEEGKTTSIGDSHQAYVIDLYTNENGDIKSALAYGTTDKNLATVAIGDSTKAGAVVFYNVNTSSPGSIRIMKKVTNDSVFADNGDEFTFKLNLSALTNIAPTGTTYTVTSYSVDGESSSLTDNNKTVTVGSDYTFTLKSGGYLQIDGLPVNMLYTVTETTANDSDQSLRGVKTTIYETAGIETSADNVTTLLKAAGDVGAGNATNSTSVISGGKTLLFVNDGQTSTLTGIVLNNLPFIIVAGVAVLGIIALILKRRRRAEEEY